MAQQTKSSTAGRSLSWRPVVIMAVVAAILFVLANSALWVNRYIFNTQNFTDVTTTSLTSESSRRAIAQQITNQALQDYPTIRGVVNNTAVNVISGVLGSDQVEVVLDKVVSKLQIVLTSNHQESIVIDLSGPKAFLTRIVDVVGEMREVKVNPDNIPSEIVLLDADKVPDFYKYGVIFMWLGPLALIGAAILSAVPYFKYRGDYKLIMLVQGGALLGASLLALLLGPLFRPPLLANVEQAEARTVVGNLFDAFMATFNAQTTALITASIIVMLVAGGLIGYSAVRQKRG